MNKIIVTIVFIVLYIISFSQDKVWVNDNYFGIHVGGIESKINLVFNDDSLKSGIENPSFTSVAVGLSYKNVSEQLGALKVGLAVDLNFFQKGGYINFNLNTDSLVTEDALFKYVPSYIELTPLMNLKLGKKLFHINFLAGPHFSYLIKEQIMLQSQITENTYKTKADKKYDIGLDFGGGFDFEFGRSCIELRLIYGIGFTDIFKPEEVNVDLWYDQNRMTSGMLYYYYKL